jgi:hypothetical protein
MPRDFLNRAGQPLVRQLLSLYPDSLVVGGMKAGGGGDLGMEAISDQFEVLCGALRDEAQLHAGGIVAARRRVVDLLARRGRTVHLLDRHPEIDALAMAAPIVITGLPHSGAETLRDLLVDRPDLDRPGDEPSLMGVHMSSIEFELDWHVPAYAEWYDEADLQPGYGWLRRLLQVQRWQDTGSPARRWVLTSMQHLEQLPALLATFPDALVVQTHRDLDAVVTDMVGSVSERRRRSSAEVNPTQIGRYWSWRAGRMLERNQHQRRALDPARVVDVAHDDLVDDPANVVAALVDQFGVAPES